MDLHACGPDILSCSFKSSDGLLRFATKTDKTWKSKRTTLWRLNSKAKQRWQVAGMEWLSCSPSRVSFLRKEMDLDMFLTQCNTYRTFCGPGGIRYAWLMQPDSMVLFDLKSEEVVARSRWVPSATDRAPVLHLEVLKVALPSLNAIFTTFVVLEHQRQSAHIKR